eukprot:3195004-Alexandrium_andersonii.AAC.1
MNLCDVCVEGAGQALRQLICVHSEKHCWQEEQNRSTVLKMPSVLHQPRRWFLSLNLAIFGHLGEGSASGSSSVSLGLRR